MRWRASCLFIVHHVVPLVVGPTQAGAKAKVGEFDVAGTVDEDVVGLDVPVDEAQGVDVFHGQRQFGRVESGNEKILNF